MFAHHGRALTGERPEHAQIVGSEKSANRVMRNISRFIEEKLGLKVNMTKSKVDRPSGLKHLGFGFYFDTRTHQFKAKPHAKSVAKFKK